MNPAPAAAAAARFRGEPSSVAEARRFVARAVGDICPGLDDHVTVIVSELASNAVLHGASDYTVSVEEVDRGVRVTVSDQGTGHPTLRRPGPTEPHGRGLQIVSLMADAWGVVPDGTGHGKAVWFELRSTGR